MPLFNSTTEGTTSMGNVVNVCDYITNFPIVTCPINDCDNQSNGLIISGQYYDLYTIIKQTDCVVTPPLNLCSPTFGFYTGEFAIAFTPFSSNEIIANITANSLDVTYDVDWGDGSPHFTGTVLAIGNNVSSPAHLYADGNYNPTITYTNPNGVVSVQTFPTLNVVAGQFDDCFVGNEFSTSTPAVTVLDNTNCGVGEIEVNLNVSLLSYTETYNIAGIGQPYSGDVEYTIKWNGVTMLTFTELGGIPAYAINQSFITNNVLSTNTIEVIAVSKDLAAGFNQVLGSFTQTIISHN